MELFEEIYKEWRWLTYNELDEMTLNMMVAGDYPLITGEKFSDNMYYTNYTDENIEKYRRKNFELSKDKIADYDQRIKQKAAELSKKNSLYYFANAHFLRSVFIENCFFLINNFTREELISKIKRNIIYYHWWDELSFEELCICIIDSHFLKSTKKLIDKEALLAYFTRRFSIKEHFINCLLSNFIPREAMIIEMNETSRGHVIFDYGWLFRNELTKSIRVFENECRLDFNEKIVGSFYNENVLFRAIKKELGGKLTVLSQGSPEWLGSQRFDIYLPEVNIAIEYQGEQHMFPVDFGGRGVKIAKKQFYENQRRDILKKDKADENNCEIIYIYPDYDFKNVLSIVKSRVQERVKGFVNKEDKK